MRTLPCLVLTFLVLLSSGCAGTSHIRGEKGVPIEGGARVSVGETSVWIMPQMRVSNGVVFVMEEGKTYWSRRFIQNNDIVRLEDDRHVERWVHLTPIEEHEIQTGDVILTCKGRNLFYLSF